MFRSVVEQEDRLHRLSSESNVSGHRFKIGQLVTYHNRDATSGVYQISSAAWFLTTTVES